MPYIKEDRKEELKYYSPSTPGELNYLLTKIIKNYLNTKGLSYTAVNDILGALEGAKLEFYRRVVVPYEDKKIKENGDVYD